MLKVITSELALMNWKVKSLMKVCTLTGVVYQALLASACPPSVNCKRVPFSLVRPLNCRPVAVNPEAKLMLGELLCMVMTEVAVLLSVKLGAVAIAFTVVVLLTVNAAVYGVDEVVGWLPSKV